MCLESVFPQHTLGWTSPSIRGEWGVHLRQVCATALVNIKFILPHCSKDAYKHSFLPVTLRAWNALPQAAVETGGWNLEPARYIKASIPGSTNYSQNCKIYGLIMVVPSLPSRPFSEVRLCHWARGGGGKLTRCIWPIKLKVIIIIKDRYFAFSRLLFWLQPTQTLQTN